MSEPRKYIAKNIRLKDQYHPLILNQTKRSTIRLGFIFITEINLELVFETKPAILINISKIDYGKSLKSLTQEDALNDGYSSLTNLKEDLKKYYPEITESSNVTILYFDIIK